MKKRIILGIGLLLILLPLITPSSMVSTNARPDTSTGSDYQLNDVTSVVEGQKLLYNISTFQYGAGIWDFLDMLLEQAWAPSFGKGIIGTLEGSELHVLVNALKNIPLYDKNESSGTYDTPPIWKDALSVFMYFELDDELGAYVNASDFSFPDDFGQSSNYLYNDTWPHADFSEPILDEFPSTFWNYFNFSFESEFERGFQDANNTYWDGWEQYWPNHWNMPYPDDWKYDGSDGLMWFATDLGEYLGYEMGWNCYWESEAYINSYDYNDKTAALNGFYAGFFMARTAGWNAGESDFLLDKIPDMRTPKPPMHTDVEEYATYYLYDHLYRDYYRGGFLYQGSLIFFNDRLYRDLYDEQWDTYWSGYANGYGDHYWSGRDAGIWDDFNSLPPYSSHNPPTWPDDPWGAHDEGYRMGAVEGYDAGYDDGYFGLFVGENTMHENYRWSYEAYFDGFANASIDYPADTPTPTTLPYASPVDPWEFAANDIYTNQYAEGYGRGHKYTMLVTSPEEISWLWSNGPFYNMTLPDAEFSFAAGSILPIGMPLTMLTDINMSLMEYEFNDMAYDYWPFTEARVPMQSVYAIGTDWTALDDLDVARDDVNGTPGFATTWNLAYDYFEMTMDMNASEPGIMMDITWGYNTSTGLLLNISASVDFYNEVDMWLDVVLELDETSEVILTPTMPSPSTWSYFIGDFVFYYDIPPTAPLDFIDGVHEFKQNGMASISQTFLTVNMLSIDHLWGRATMTLQNPSNLTEPPAISEYRWPLFSGGGPLWLTDWDYWDGVYTTANSILGHYTYFVDALNELAIQNYNVDLTKIIFEVALGEYYHAPTGVQYYYVTLQADLDFGWTMLNGDFVWETTTQVGWVNATFYAGIDYATSVVIGGGARASFDFLVYQNPDYGFNGGQMDAYIELQIGSTFKPMLDLFGLIGHMFPEVPEYGLISMLGIIGLAAVASAVIFSKKKK